VKEIVATYTLFTDSSFHGWGAVLIHNTTKEVWSTGGSW
jgi:hypothetical protein